MAHTFTLPDLGEGLTEGEIARWLVSEGETVAENDPILEIQTDKATVEIGSPVDGVVLRILVAEGEVAPVGATLAVIGAAGELLLRPVEQPPPPLPERAEPIVTVVGSEPLELLQLHRLARELSVDLGALRGTGPGGRLTEADLRAAAAPPEGRRIPIRGIRRAILEQVERTHREIPAVTFVEECDFTGVDLDLLVPLSLKAAAASLRAFPELNARIEDDQIVLLERYDLGVAVDTEAGLVVPVVRGCDVLSVAEIDAEVRRLAAGARGGTLQPDEVRDSTFTVTSAGRLGGLLVTPLINHPEVAILGVHRIGPRPVVRDGAIVAREMGNVSVTFDHRVVDGARAGAFCIDVIRRLEAHAQPVH
jgi:pyruvate/2-oxoglutarate dehydrogenase complex dihydrolipoamide acyltransferase (E2) component